jgi:putative membrane protein
MKFGRIQFTVLIAAEIFASQTLVVRAQNEPMSPPASSTQPNQPNQQQPGTVSMQDSSGAADANMGLMRDKQFLRKATEGGIAEVELGKLAAQKGSSDDVKSYGQKMVDDHTTLNQQLATVADEMGLRLPKTISSTGKTEYDKLNGLSGSDFDTEYIIFMVKDHHVDFRDFRTEATSATDANLREVVAKAAIMIRDHTILIEKIAKDKGVALPGRRQGPPPAGSAPPPAPPQ